MGKTRYKRMAEMLEKLKAEHGNRVTMEIFQEAFMMNIGCDIRTKKDAIKQLLELKMISEENNGWLKIA